MCIFGCTVSRQSGSLPINVFLSPHLFPHNVCFLNFTLLSKNIHGRSCTIFSGHVKSGFDTLHSKANSYNEMYATTVHRSLIHRRSSRGYTGDRLETLCRGDMAVRRSRNGTRLGHAEINGSSPPRREWRNVLDANPRSHFRFLFQLKRAKDPVVGQQCLRVRGVSTLGNMARLYSLIVGIPIKISMTLERSIRTCRDSEPPLGSALGEPR